MSAIKSSSPPLSHPPPWYTAGFSSFNWPSPHPQGLCTCCYLFRTFSHVPSTSLINPFSSFKSPHKCQHYFQKGTFLTSQTSLSILHSWRSPWRSLLLFTYLQLSFQTLVERSLPTFVELMPGHGTGFAKDEWVAAKCAVSRREPRGAWVPFTKFPSSLFPAAVTLGLCQPGCLSDSTKQTNPAHHLWTCSMARKKLLVS